MNPTLSNTSQTWPLCSLTVMTYNQEAFVRDTLRSALAQTYPNLEIIVSDDCSTDRTWIIIQEEVSKYKGPHQIILNRNEHNEGFGPHICKLLKMLKGSILVLGAGDDIFLPQRVQRTYEAFEKLGSNTMLIWCNHEPIDEDGKSRGVYKDFNKDVQRIPHCLSELTAKTCRKGWWPIGALMACRREVCDTFDAMNPVFTAEDTVLSFRALLLGKMEYIDEVLVQYRHHSGSISNAEQLPDIQKEYRKRMKGDCARIQSYAQALMDTNLIKQKHPEQMALLLKVNEMLLGALKRQLVSCEIMSTFPHISLRTFWRVLPYPGFHRHIVYALLYKIGFYREKKIS